MIVIVTTSVWQKDRDKALQTDLVTEFIAKPSTRKSLQKLSEKDYKNYPMKNVT